MAQVSIPLKIEVEYEPAYYVKSVHDRRFRYVALFCAVIVALFAIATCSCTPAPQVPVATRAAVRDEVQQMRGTVLLEVFCIKSSPFGDRPATLTSFDVSAATGSGTLLDDRHVLTAHHVINCGYASTIRVTTFDGRHVMGYVDRDDPGLDLARLELGETVALGMVPPVIIGAKPGDTLCASYAYPGRGTSCGSVLYVNAPGDSNIFHDARTEHGNSGGGVFVGGSMVGVVTRLIPCDLGASLLDPSLPGCGGTSTGLVGLHEEWFR